MTETILDRLRLGDEERARRPPSTWGVCETCGARTHDLKPRCAEHVLELAYARRVAREARRRGWLA